MNIAILGGSFDPPHNGHVAIAKRLITILKLDEIWLMPCFQHPFNKNVSGADKRLKMTKYLEKDGVRVSDFEIGNKTTSYSIDTLSSLMVQFPNYRFSWIIGTDQVETFCKWKDWKKIINNYRLIIVPRGKYRKAKKEVENLKKQVTNPQNILLIDVKHFKPVYVSSTLIRKKLKAGRSISRLVPKKIEKYIINHGLYKNSPN